MSQRQVLWQLTATFLTDHKCALRDASPLEKLDKSQIAFEKKMISIPTGGKRKSLR